MRNREFMPEKCLTYFPPHCRARVRHSITCHAERRGDRGWGGVIQLVSFTFSYLGFMSITTACSEEGYSVNLSLPCKSVIRIKSHEFLIFQRYVPIQDTRVTSESSPEFRGAIGDLYPSIPIHLLLCTPYYLDL